MPRTTGAKDKEPRAMNPASLAALPQATPGHTSAVVRIFARVDVITLLTDLSAKERGKLITMVLSK